ncbi:hypothetical protein CR513_07824, partial [Mucuna pruriens]
MGLGHLALVLAPDVFSSALYRFCHHRICTESVQWCLPNFSLRSYDAFVFRGFGRGSKLYRLNYTYSSANANIFWSFYAS